MRFKNGKDRCDNRKPLPQCASFPYNFSLHWEPHTYGDHGQAFLYNALYELHSLFCSSVELSQYDFTQRKAH